MDDQSCIEIKNVGNVSLVTFNAASISDSEQISEASQKIDAYIEKNHPATIVVDFDGVKFFSSQVLGILLSARAKLETLGGEIVISAINPQLHRVFTITNLDKIFRFFPDSKTAIAAM